MIGALVLAGLIVLIWPEQSALVGYGLWAVAGITRADEPVAELLARFEAAAIARAGAPEVRRIEII